MGSPALSALLEQLGAGTPAKCVAASYTRASDATQYAIGDLIGNSQTAAQVVPVTFSVSRPKIGYARARLNGARCTLAAASGTIVLPAFDLLVFRPVASIPFAAAGYPADNAALNVSAAAMRELVAVYVFSATAWRNQAGGTTAAGPAVWQAVNNSGRALVPFDLSDISGAATLLGLMQAQNTWNPGAVAQQFDLALDLIVD